MRFPGHASFIRDGKPAPSSLAPEVVAPLVAEAFAEPAGVTMAARSA